MQPQSLNLTHIRSALSVGAALRGSATDGERYGPPPGGRVTGVPGRRAERNSIPCAGPRVYNEAQRPSGMTCARRLAGARTPAPSTSAGPRRPDARIGRARLSLLPALALLLGALSLFAAGTAEAAPAAPTSPNVKVGDRGAWS